MGCISSPDAPIFRTISTALPATSADHTRLAAVSPGASSPLSVVVARLSAASRKYSVSSA